MDDARLLQAYSRDRDQAAFATLVHRHADLVHSAALRRMNGDPHAAQEVTQRVFIALARKASALLSHPALPAWLHRCTRNAAIDLHREQTRRRAREATLLAENAAPPEPASDWTVLAPVLDACLDTLGENDRQTVVLRYFSNLPFADIAAALGTAEAAAQMRAARALEKLRRALAIRGVTSTAVVAATATATAAGAGLAFFTAMTTSTKLALGVAAVLVFASLGWWGHAVFHPAASSPRPALAVPHSGATKPPPPASSPESAAQLQARLTASQNRLADIERELTKLRQNAAGRSALVESMIWDRHTKNNRPGADARSLFPDVAAAGLYLADANLRLLALSRDFTELPAVGTPAYDDFQKRLESALKFISVVLQDDLLLTEFSSHDPARISRAQAAYITPALALQPDQAAAVTEIIRQATAEVFTNSTTATAPDAETRGATAKRSLNDQAVTRIKSLLTPDQQTLFTQLGYNDLLFRLHYTLE